MAVSDTVTVACKLPNGLVCSIIDMDDFKANIDAMKANKPYVQKIKGKFRLRGYQDARRSDTSGHVETEARHVIGLFGLTTVPKSQWDEWYDQNKDYPAVKNRLIYAHAQRSSAEAYSREHAELKTGFDPLDPHKPAPGILPENFEGMNKDEVRAQERSYGMPPIRD